MPYEARQPNQECSGDIGSHHAGGSVRIDLVTEDTHVLEAGQASFESQLVL